MQDFLKDCDVSVIAQSHFMCGHPYAVTDASVWM